MTADEYDTGEVASPRSGTSPGANLGGKTGTGAAPAVASSEGHHADRTEATTDD